MTQPDASQTPDYEALRDSRPDDQGSGDQLAADQGPATGAENAVDEDMGRAES